MNKSKKVQRAKFMKKYKETEKNKPKPPSEIINRCVNAELSGKIGKKDLEER